jgi:hypothetical protein
MAAYINREIPFENCYMQSDSSTYKTGKLPANYDENELLSSLNGLDGILPKLPFGISYFTAIKYGLIGGVALWAYMRFGKYLVKKK